MQHTDSHIHAYANKIYATTTLAIINRHRGWRPTQKTTARRHKERQTDIQILRGREREGERERERERHTDIQTERETYIQRDVRLTHRGSVRHLLVQDADQYALSHSLHLVVVL